MTKGEGGQKSQKIDDVIYERPHIVKTSFELIFNKQLTGTWAQFYINILF